ncbi:hypothetical protein KC842_02210 [Candidatus Nomurabacteria bacterium]|nr:hypothetical protein [Candidatus Nomurabacteria bacterium]USN94982.1 MAG: hypothetical protein H6791_00950 [Candidatus Nomurabacteria bacterium]
MTLKTKYSDRGHQIVDELKTNEAKKDVSKFVTGIMIFLTSGFLLIFISLASGEKANKSVLTTLSFMSMFFFVREIIFFYLFSNINIELRNILIRKDNIEKRLQNVEQKFKIFKFILPNEKYIDAVEKDIKKVRIYFSQSGVKVGQLKI